IGPGSLPIIRIRGPAHDIIKRALDTGAHGIMIPQINTAEEAGTNRRLFQVPAVGVRGRGSAFPAVGHGLTTPEYMKSSNETIITMIQIETRAGVENVEAICAVQGVDLVFIGPNDLAQVSIFLASVQPQQKMHNMTRLNGKTVVITGGATGIGRAAAKRFIEEGAFVFIFGRRQEALDAALADLGPNARAVKGSVSDLADLDRLHAAVRALLAALYR
ncbi:Pyruvate/Phosphoenolpyruvate kinase-like domain-containing protein, partial [Lipomyces kononenkoae]